MAASSPAPAPPPNVCPPPARLGNRDRFRRPTRLQLGTCEMLSSFSFQSATALSHCSVFHQNLEATLRVAAHRRLMSVQACLLCGDGCA